MVAALTSSYALLVATLFDTMYWKTVATTPEPERCAICKEGDGNCYNASVLVNHSAGTVRELEIYDSNPRGS